MHRPDGVFQKSAMGCIAVAALFSLSTGAQAASHHGDTTQENTQAEVTYSATGQTISAIQNHLAPVQNAFDLPGAPPRESDPAGMAGGDDLFDWSGWASLGGGYNENTFTATKTNGWNAALTVGADTPIGGGATGGLLLSVTRDHTDTVYNTGTIDYTGVSVAPYFSFSINDWLSADASFGGSYANSHQTRTAVGIVTGDYTTSSYFASANLNAAKWMGSWLLSGRAGVNGSSSTRDAFTESDATVNAASSSSMLQASLGGTIGYWAAPALFYVSSTYVYDISRPTPAAGASTDPDELRLSIGATLYGSGETENITGGFSLSKTFLRDEHESTSAEANFRVKF